MSEPIRAPFTVKAVGVTFVDGYPDNLLDLARIADAAAWQGEELPAVLVRAHDNEHDSNAVAVHVPAIGDDGRVGWVPRALAARLGPLIDDGWRYAASVVEVRVDPMHLDRPGILIRCTPIPHEETSPDASPQP